MMTQLISPNHDGDYVKYIVICTLGLQYFAQYCRLLFSPCTTVLYCIDFFRTLPLIEVKKPSTGSTLYT